VIAYTNKEIIIENVKRYKKVNEKRYINNYCRLISQLYYKTTEKMINFLCNFLFVMESDVIFSSLKSEDIFSAIYLILTTAKGLVRLCSLKRTLA